MSQVAVVRTDLGRVLREQDGVLTAAQAYDLGGRAWVRSQMRRHLWQSPTRGVYVTHNGPLTEAQRRWVALLAAPSGSALGGITALRLDGFTALAPTGSSEVPRVVQPISSWRSRHTDVVTHWSSMLDHRDVHPLRLPRRTRPERSVLDEASWSVHPRRARAVVLSAAQQGLVVTRGLREAMTRRGACRHRALLVESYLDARGGIQSLPERDFDDIRRRVGAPRPTRQARVKRDDGRYYLDVEWEELETACEIHGIPHLMVEQWDGDLMRANEIVIDGPRLLIFSSYAVRHEPDAVASQLVRMLRRGGWRG
ncbi:hypothetical protein [Solicola sp. PLA-1-18]|uniref:hypothetical protein n=1 Tax=Solicola sp. PLA-1-18 TaxID=3380532 RepID=UPI003B7F4394